MRLFDFTLRLCTFTKDYISLLLESILFAFTQKSILSINSKIPTKRCDFGVKSAQLEWQIEQTQCTFEYHLFLIDIR